MCIRDRYLYRKFIYAHISAPTRIHNEYKEYSQKINLFSEITSDAIPYTVLMDIIPEIILLAYNYTHGQCLTYTEFSGILFRIYLSADNNVV